MASKEDIPTINRPLNFDSKGKKLVFHDEDDPAMDVAINESVQSSEESADASADPPQVAPRVTIDDMIGKLKERNNNITMPNFDDPEGDTWIFIDAVQRQPEQSYLDYEAYVERCATPFRLKKEILMKLNSPVITNYFSPGAQYRLLRRRKLVNKLADGIKYVLDLTAPTEGDDAALLLSSLSCSEGLRGWHRAKKAWSVQATMVGGREEYVSGLVSALSGHADDDLGDFSKCPEYTPLRHRAAIERLLAIATGVDPNLDSAIKVWTTFAVAKYFGIVQSPLTDFIVRWLRGHPNSVFLEVLTEASHSMADHLQVFQLERDTFAMLVGEEALDSMVRARVIERARVTEHSLLRSTFGRKKEDLPEKIKSRVEYASKKFADRMIEDFNNLREAKWVHSLPEIQKLSSFTQPELQDTISRLKTMLVDWVKGFLMHVQCTRYCAISQLNQPPVGTEGLFPNTNRLTILNSLSSRERLLTRTFWDSLRDLTPGSSNLDVSPGWSESYALVRPFPEPTLEKDGHHRVQKSAIWSIIEEGERTLSRLSGANAHSNYEGLHFTKSAPSKVSWGDRSATGFPYKDLSLRPKVEIIHQQPSDQGPLPSHENLANSETQRASNSSLSPDMSSPKIPAEPFGKSTLRISRFQEILDPSEEQVAEASGVSALTNMKKMSDQKSTDDIAEPDMFRWEDSFPSEAALLSRKIDSQRIKDGSSQQEHQIGDAATPERPANDIQQPDGFASDNDAFTSPKPPSPPSYLFSFINFRDEVSSHISTIASMKLSYTDTLNCREPYELKLLNTLVSLDEPEFKYLPLWAGGCDDDSGGVFNDEVAIPDVSFSTAGPDIQHGAGMHTVSECDTISLVGLRRDFAMMTPGTSVASSEYGFVHHRGSTVDDGSDTASTILPSSNHTTAGYLSENLDATRIYAADSLDSSSSVGQDTDDYSIVDNEEGGVDVEEANARREIAAMELAEAEKDSAERIGRSGREVEDESYADLWGGEEDDGDAFEDDDEAMGMEEDELSGFESEGDAVMVDGDGDDNDEL